MILNTQATQEGIVVTLRTAREHHYFNMITHQHSEYDTDFDYYLRSHGINLRCFEEFDDNDRDVIIAKCIIKADWNMFQVHQALLLHWLNNYEECLKQMHTSWENALISTL